MEIPAWNFCRRLFGGIEMNVLEKILEEIEKEQNSYEADHAWNYSKGMEYAKEIIRSHMDHSGDDTEMGDWISVEERLPEEKTEVLCCFEDGTVQTLWQDWKRDGFGDYLDDDLNPTQVIAWQPLPAPYKPKKQD